MVTTLLIIDPQNDFCSPEGSLFVPGADDDMDRLASMIDRYGHNIDKIHVTLDSHHSVDISHPAWWKDRSGSEPAPFTVITSDDVSVGTWSTQRHEAHHRSLAYLHALESQEKYPHVIWPEHCLIGSNGHNIYSNLFDSIYRWEKKNLTNMKVVNKGDNIWTEHFSAVKAEVTDLDDLGTQLNSNLIYAIEASDTVLIAGEALSHCVASSVRDIATFLADPKHIEKFVLLTDATSPVSTFEQLGEDFVSDLTSLGMRTMTTTEL